MQGGFGSLTVFEVHKHVSPPCKICDLYRHFSTSFRRIFLLPQTKVQEIGGLDVQGHEFFALSPTKRCIRLAQEVVDFIGKPRYVPKLKRGAEMAGKSLQKLLE